VGLVWTKLTKKTPLPPADGEEQCGHFRTALIYALITAANCHCCPNNYYFPLLLSATTFINYFHQLLSSTTFINYYFQLFHPVPFFLQLLPQSARQIR
jgi:hypothetical protein